MKKLILLVVLLVAANAKLAFVVEMFRHGARGPLNTFYDGPQQPYMWGELTSTGQRQHYYLGQQLRKEYIIEQNFLNPSYNHSEMYVRSTDVNRTLNSAASQLYGMFPVGTGPSIPKGIDTQQLMPPYNQTTYKPLGEAALPNFFQTIPIHTVTDNSQDKVLNPYGTCPTIWTIINTWRAEKEQQDMLNFLNSEFAVTLQTLSQILDSTNVNLGTIGSIYDIFIVDKYQKRPVPAGLTPEIMKNLTFLNDYMCYFNLRYNVTLGLLNTIDIQMLVDQLDGIYYNTTTTPNLKWMMLSAHDTNLATHMPVFNLTSADCIYDLFFKGRTDALNCNPYPPFAANLILEMHKQDNSNDYDIKIRYNGKYQNLCERQQVTCPYLEFRERILYRIYQNPDEFKQLCGLAKSTSSNPENVALNQTGSQDVEINPQLIFWIILVAVLIKILSSKGSKRVQTVSPQMAERFVEVAPIQPNRHPQVVYTQIPLGTVYQQV